MQYGDTKIINGQLMKLTPVGYMPVKQTGRDQMSIGGVGGGQTFDPSGLQAQIDANKNLLSNIPSFDPSNLQSQIGSLQDKISGFSQFDPSGLQSQIQANKDLLSNIPQFDPSGLQEQIQANKQLLSNIPQFDPSELQAGIAGLSDRISNIPQFDDRALQDRIDAIENRYSTGFDELNRNIGNIPSYDDSTLRDRLSALEGREMPTFDPSNLQQQIEANRNLLGNIPQFDDSALQERLASLEGREIPTFDPSNLQSGIAGLRDRLDNLNIPEYKAPDLSGFARLEDLPQIDTSKFLTAGDLPRFDPKDFREDFLSIAREGIQMPEYKAPDLSGFARKEDIPTFDRDALIEDIRSGINIPKPPSFDREKLIEDIRGGIKIPEFDRESLLRDIRSELPTPLAFDRQKLIEDVRAGIDIPQPTNPFDPSNLQKRLTDLENRNIPAFDPSGLQNRLQELEQRLSELQTPAQPEPSPLENDYTLPQPQPIEPMERLPIRRPEPPMSIGGIGGGSRLPEVRPITEDPSVIADRNARTEYSNQLRAGGDAFRAAFPDAPQRPRIGTMDIRMYIDPITGEQKEGSSTDISYRNRLKQYLDANPAAMESYQQNVLSVTKPESMIQGPRPVRGGPAIPPGGPIRADLLPPPRGGRFEPEPVIDPVTGLADLTAGKPAYETPVVGEPVRNIMRPPQLPPKRDDFMSIGGPGGGAPDPRTNMNIETRDTEFGPVTISSPAFDIGKGQQILPPMGNNPPPTPDVGLAQPAPATDPVTTAPTPSAADSEVQPQPMPVGALDPVLLGQTSQETLTDPLVRALYFGTADQPGFYQQLQQAGANLIGQDVPLQQTAGLTPLELLARQQAVAGLGGFEPFLQQNRDLVEQAIAQSRRAEELQDPYYTQAEEIYKDTMGAYDPSMTQQFYNPFEQAVVDKTVQDVMEAGEKQDIASRAREISSGAFGGSRARLGAEERREALGEGLAQALGAIRQRGFSEAQSTGMSEFARQQAAKRTGAQGLMGIGVGRGSAASQLGQQLAGYGSQIGGIGSTQEGLRAGQRGELAGFGGVGRGIAETGLSRIYQQMLRQQERPLGVLGQIGSMLPGYQQGSTQIGSQYGLPTDPSAAGLGAAFSAYGALAPRQGQG